MNLKLPLLYLPDKAVLKDMVTAVIMEYDEIYTGRVTGNVDIYYFTGICYTIKKPGSRGIENGET